MGPQAFPVPIKLIYLSSIYIYAASSYSIYKSSHHHYHYPSIYIYIIKDYT